MKKCDKRGFTLVEMMLAIAIALIVGGLFITLIVTIRSSYYRAYNDDDCADIAAMYAEALENRVLYCVQHRQSDKITLSADDYILTSEHADLGFTSIENFNKSSVAGEATLRTKWVIRMVCDFDNTTGEFTYVFYFLDNYIQPGYLHYVYEGSFWIPSYSEFIQQTVGVGDVMDDYDSENTWDYNYVAPSRPFTITCTPSISTVTGTDQFAPGQPIRTRIQSDGIGNMEVDETSDTVKVPSGSSEVVIDFS